MRSSKLQQLDKASLGRVMEEVERALQAIGEKYGLDIEANSGTVSGMGEGAAVRVALRVREVDRHVNAAMAEYVSALGLPVDIMGKRILLQGRLYTVAGLEPNRPKNAVELRREPDGRMFKASPLMVKTAKQA